MPGPSLIVTFEDADGDEFPVRVGLGPLATDRARQEARKLVDEGRWRPNGELRVKSTEEV